MQDIETLSVFDIEMHAFFSRKHHHVIERV